MDVRCSDCGEPVEVDYFHEVAEEQGSSFDAVRKAFYEEGCVALGMSHGTGKAHPGVAALMELCGDDIDGLAADLEDFEYLGMM